MAESPANETRVIDWTQYQDFELTTADGVLIGFVTGNIEESGDGEPYLEIEGAGNEHGLFQIPAKAVGIISNFRLILDVRSEGIEFLDAEEVEESHSRRRRAGAGPGGDSSPLTPDVPSTPSGNNGTASERMAAGEPHLRLISADPLQESPDTEPIETAEDQSSERQPRQLVPYRERAVRRRTTQPRDRLEIPVIHPHPREEPYQSSLLQALNRRTELLEQLVLDIYMRQSTVLGSELDWPRDPITSISPVEQPIDDIADLEEEYDSFAERSLADLDVVYLFAGPVYESLRKHAGIARDFLATWGISGDGSQILVHVTLGNNERHADWMAHFESLTAREMNPPVTVTTDGTPGLIEAVQEAFPEARRIRCWATRMTQVLDEAPATIRPGLKLWLKSIRDAPDLAQGQQMAASVQKKFEENYPDAMRVFKEDLEAGLAHLALPVTHRRVIRAATLAEQNILNDWNRGRVLAHLRDEESALRFVFAVLMRTSRTWQRVRFTWTERQQLEQM